MLYEEYRKKHGDKPFVPTMNAEQREQVEKQKFSEMTKEQQDKWYVTQTSNNILTSDIQYQCVIQYTNVNVLLYITIIMCIQVGS